MVEGIKGSTALQFKGGGRGSSQARRAPVCFPGGWWRARWRSHFAKQRGVLQSKRAARPSIVKGWADGRHCCPLRPSAGPSARLVLAEGPAVDSALRAGGGSRQARRAPVCFWAGGGVRGGAATSQDGRWKSEVSADVLGGWATRGKRAPGADAGVDAGLEVRRGARLDLQGFSESSVFPPQVYIVPALCKAKPEPPAGEGHVG